MKIKLKLFLFFITISFAGYSQQDKTKPLYKGKMESVEYISSMMSRPDDLAPSDTSRKEAKDKRSLGPMIKEEAKGKNRKSHEDDYFVKNRNEMEQSIPSNDPSLIFDAFTTGVNPTDPSLAIGPDHVMVVFNTGFTIYDKSGNQLLGQTSPNPAIFPSGGCCDLTVSYDNAADRWVLSFLGDGAQIAVSDGPNPLTAGWFVYNIPQIEDYQKLSIWSDGYYMTDNTGSEDKLWALERDAMLVGDPNAQIISFDLPGLIDGSNFISPQALNITDNNTPAPGGATIIYMQDDEWNGVERDHIKVWTADVDWSNTSNSTISEPTEIDVTPFVSVFDDGGFDNLDQPGIDQPIDALQATIMNQAQFRKFDTHNSAIFNFVVDTDGTDGKLAGVRWYEFRQDGDNQPWSLYQEGTYTAPDGRHAWMASMAMDGQGNIAMGYSSMSGPTTPTDIFVSSYYTGRAAGDPLGVMTRTENLIANGEGLLDTDRYGDYSKMDVDPSDDSTFWFITEYVTDERIFDKSGVVGRFQLGEAAPADTESPTDPSDLIASNITQNSATVSWTESSDNIEVVSYNISLDDTPLSSSTTTSIELTELLPSTTYTISVNAQDAAGNVSGTTNTTFTTLDDEDDNDNDGVFGIIAGYFFETGFEGWIDGGSDCTRARSVARSFEGRRSIRLRDNTISSIVTSPEINLRRNLQVAIEFHVYPNSMEPGEDFFVEFFNGRDYEVIGNYVSGKDFENDVFFSDKIILDASSFRFNRRNRFRFRCDASGNRDFIYIDAITISGNVGRGGRATDDVNPTVDVVSTPVEPQTVTTLREFTEDSQNNIKIYPNPTVSELTIEIADKTYDKITVFSSTGAIVQNIDPNEDALSMDVSNLPAGMYFVRFVSKDGLAVTKRFIKQ